jgi:hypothetical protein
MAAAHGVAGGSWDDAAATAGARRAATAEARRRRMAVGAMSRRARPHSPRSLSLSVTSLGLRVVGGEVIAVVVVLGRSDGWADEA